MYKKHKIIMLPIEEKSVLFIGRVSRQLHDLAIANKDSTTNNQNLYIVSDEEIKEGDWYYNSKNSTVNQLTSHYGNIKESVAILNNNKYCHKVIATTDKELHAIKFRGTKLEAPSKCLKGVAVIPQQFIEEWIAEYNKGNVIEDLEVEYEVRTDFKDSFDAIDGPAYKLKISKDNFISIKRKEQRSYIREEVIRLIEKYHASFATYPTMNLDLRNNWIKKNL